MKRLLIMAALLMGAASHDVVSAAAASVTVRGRVVCPLCNTENRLELIACSFCETDLSSEPARLAAIEWLAELQKPEVWNSAKLAEGYWTIQSAARELIGDMREVRIFGYRFEGAVASLDTKWNGTYKGDFKKLYTDYCKFFKA